MSADKLAIEIAPVFEPLLEPSRYKGAWGGRGSGKSQAFADLIIIRALQQPGLRVLCCREIQKSLKESAKRLLESKIEQYGVGGLFEVQSAEIKTPGGGTIVFAGLQDHTSESIKSYEGFDIAWVEEAQTVSHRSMNLLRPTIRKPGSEIWLSWNPRFDTDAVDEMLRGEEVPSGAIVVKANWNNNPWFPAELEQERLDCIRQQPEQYDHIWEGGYADSSGTRFTDGAGSAVNYCVANANGKAEFYWTPATGQVLQVLDTADEQVDIDADFADKFVIANLPGEVPQSSVTDLETDLTAINSEVATKAATADLAATTSGKGALLVGLFGGGTVQDALPFVVPTGTTATEVQAAIDTGTDVFLGTSTYTIATPLTMNAGQRIFGNGATLQASGAINEILLAADNAIIEGITFDCANTQPGSGVPINSDGAGAGVRIRDVTGCTLRKCKFTKYRRGISITSSAAGTACSDHLIESVSTLRASIPDRPALWFGVLCRQGHSIPCGSMANGSRLLASCSISWFTSVKSLTWATCCVRSGLARLCSTPSSRGTRRTPQLMLKSGGPQLSLNTSPRSSLMSGRRRWHELAGTRMGKQAAPGPRVRQADPYRVGR